MDLFHRAQVPAERNLTWIKPFDARMDEILRLRDKAESAPKEMKKVFLSAWAELAEEVKKHQKTASSIVESGLPLQVYYNVVLQSEVGTANIDFLILSDDFVVVVLHKGKEHIEWDQYDTRFAKVPLGKNTSIAEDYSCIVSDILLDSKGVPQKELYRVVPVLIDPEEDAMSAKCRPVGRSLLYPDISACLTVHPDAFTEWLMLNCATAAVPFFNEKRLDKILSWIGESIVS
ncbi:MAG: NERD domain-containing protein [Clostridiales bacterium]|nr:NERD domain-containing protein [Clostridiales bacterium]